MDRRRRAKEDEEGERERETDDDDGDSQCGGALWELAKRMPDLQMLSTVQQMTSLNFFKPFGRRSRRRFTLFAPTDAAFFQAFSEHEDLRGTRAGLTHDCQHPPTHPHCFDQCTPWRRPCFGHASARLVPPHLLQMAPPFLSSGP